MAKEFLDYLLAIREQNVPYAVATVIDVVGSTSAKTGSKALIDQHGNVVTGWVGGGCAESTACHAAQRSMESGETEIIDIDLDDEVLGVGMPCGGHMRVYIEPSIPKPTVWIMGHGEVAEYICQLSDLMGFAVVVNDSMAQRDKFPQATWLITDDIDYGELNPLPGDFVVIATQHKGDHESMTRALQSDAQYIALIASRKRSRLVMDYLRRKNFSEDDIKRVMAPCGIDIGARTPAEIALSVISEIVLVRRQASGVRMRDTLHREVPSPRAAADATGSG
ncbi:MAG: XdhC family protein [Gammaproteobacteria bacterium]|nr:XdhC family protein [Gammaproteobacteria bacterium]MDH3534841.1 XdhC family protein [Gammaproteobacteria bacterium]